MGKRHTFERNIIALTGGQDLQRALRQWAVERVVCQKRTSKMLSCELCGTRFWHGAFVAHPRHKATIAVGGVCLRTLLMQRFGHRRRLDQQRSETRHILRKSYGYLIDVGSWIRWIVQNAPRTLMQAAVELEQLGATANRHDLRRLMRFHDHRRRYPREAILPNWETIAPVARVPEYLTINRAKELARRIAARRRVVSKKTRLARYVLEFRNTEGVDRSAFALALAFLGDLGRRSILALYVLARVCTRNESLCSDDLASQWPLLQMPLTRSAFVWHPRLGLGLAEADHAVSHAQVFLFHLGEYSAERYDLSYWRSVECESEEAVGVLEKLAFREMKPPEF